MSGHSPTLSSLLTLLLSRYYSRPRYLFVLGAIAAMYVCYVYFLHQTTPYVCTRSTHTYATLQPSKSNHPPSNPSKPLSIRSNYLIIQSIPFPSYPSAVLYCTPTIYTHCTQLNTYPTLTSSYKLCSQLPRFPPMSLSSKLSGLRLLYFQP